MFAFFLRLPYFLQVTPSTTGKICKVASLCVLPNRLFPSGYTMSTLESPRRSNARNLPLLSTSLLETLIRPGSRVGGGTVYHTELPLLDPS